MKKQQVFYIHGGESFSNKKDFLNRLITKEIWDLPWVESKGKWTQTLAKDLGESYEVFLPAMPNKNNADYEEWKIWFERHFEHVSDGLILIGCSMGAMFLSKYLASNEPPFSIKALILMAGFVGGAKPSEGIGSFEVAESLLPMLSGKADNIIIMHSKDDFVVPFAHALKYQEALPEAEFIVFDDKNHFLIEEFPELIIKIKEIVSK